MRSSLLAEPEGHEVVLVALLRADRDQEAEAVSQSPKLVARARLVKVPVVLGHLLRGGAAVKADRVSQNRVAPRRHVPMLPSQPSRHM